MVAAPHNQGFRVHDAARGPSSNGIRLLAAEAGVHCEDGRLRELIDAATHLGRRYMFDEAHAVHVAGLSGMLYDDLRELHGLGKAERRWLHVAAILHDIGRCAGNKGHHKRSLYLIANSELPGLPRSELRIVANVARYHRKSEPDMRHELYAGLAADGRRKVRLLAAVLRLADALDRDHMQRIRLVRATIRGSKLRVELEGFGSPLERWHLQRKSEFFTRVYGCAIQVVAGVR
jgi:exopolyphosphatase/guanosine-5'-triphosphate,3'-diphosphate pyrophosphatase